MKTGSDSIIAGRDDFEDFNVNATENNKRSKMVGDEIDSSPNKTAKIDDSIVIRHHQVVNKPSLLGAKAIPSHEINFYDCVSR